MTYGKRLLEAMKLRGVSRRELSESLGVTSHAIGMVTRPSEDEKFLSRTNHQEAVRVLRVNDAWLMRGEGPMEGLPTEHKKNELSAAAEALARMFDRVPTSDALAWSTLYHSLVQAISARIPEQTQSLPPDSGMQPAESRALKETHKNQS
jgi:transcriptional regulator with XRE-family HTH domain